MKKLFYLSILLLIPIFCFTSCNRSSEQETVQNSLLVPQESRYHMPDASEVFFVWGINGWNVLPEEMFSAETFVQNKVMHTPMQPEGDDFVVRIAVPEGATINYGFLVTKDGSGAAVATWDGDYQVVAEVNRVIEAHQTQLVPKTGAATIGKDLFVGTCSVCHGPTGEGIPGLGKDLTNSEFIASKSDDQLVDFIKVGRDTEDPSNSTGIAMPPKGGNPALSDEELYYIVAFMRTLDTTIQSEVEETSSSIQNQEPIVVKGFTLVPYSIQSERYITSLEFGANGVLYVCSYDGSIWAIPDHDGDGMGDEPQLYAEGFEKPVGLAWHDEELYVASLGKITALHDQDGDGHVDKIRDIVSNLPGGIQPVHANNDLIIGPDGRLYFGVGSTSDASPEIYQYAASILSVNLDGSNLRVEATGVRNPYDMAFNRAGDLFATDNGPDGEGASTFPPDELNHIVPGGDYGFPHYFGVPEIDSGTLGPVLLFPVHSAPAGIAFYYANQFPPEYEGNVFVALWNRGQIYRVQFVQTTTGEYVAKGSVFASGLPGVVDVTVGPDGRLYVSVSESGTVYQISYKAP